MNIYLVGSLRNPRIPVIAELLRDGGHEVFDDWFAAGEKADDAWQAYETARGHTFEEALGGHSAQHVFWFDRKHLQAADAVVLVLPAGKSGHLELGWALGQGKLGYVLLEDKDSRWDVMYAFADAVVVSVPELLEKLLESA